MNTYYFILTLLAYLIGSVSSAILVCRWLRLPNPTLEGSKNPGATNVLRVAGKKAALLTLAGDMFKGFLPVVLAKILVLPDWILACVALAAFMGHLFPIFFRFQGGKGVATLFGTLLGLSGPLGLSVILTWLMMAGIFRYSSLAALVAAVSAPLYACYFFSGKAVFIIALMSLFLILRHRKNIVSLIHHQEPKIGN